MYFGEAIALYFTFLGYYTTALFFPLFLGFVQLFASTETVPFFCVFNVVWVTVFLEVCQDGTRALVFHMCLFQVWKRKSNELAFRWGTIGMTSLDEPRPNFCGHMGVDPVTGRVQPQYPRWKTNAKMYLVSFPIVIFCMMLAFCVMLASFWCEDLIRKMEDEFYLQFVLLPSIVYAALVYIMNRFYRSLATYLTEWGNSQEKTLKEPSNSSSFREPQDSIPIRPPSRLQTCTFRVRQQLHVPVLHRVRNPGFGNA